uniref:Major facilitator superfamily domain-containing protein 6-A n=2 Tax=Ceratitis capitata TaxID=7213 RepID=W8BJ11_CERCA
MKDLKNGTACKPMIECQVIDPYDSKGSVLADSECIKITGDLDATLGGYTAIRLLGDIFVLAALTLLNTAIVIAVRETSEGRGEVCRQYAWGAIGYVLLFSPIDLFAFNSESKHDAALVALILVIVCLLIGALVLLFASQMPLSPPEWWWHTKTGMLVYPMSAIRRYSPEIFVLTLVAILFGTFWSSIHSFLIWTFSDANAVTYSGLILVLVLFFNVDKFIEYCGHSNIFIAGFAVFIIRFTALSGEGTQWLTVVMEAIEPVVVGVVWITIILYMRHAMPRKLTATGQAVAVLAFFGIGKGLGAVIGLARDDKEPKVDAQAIHQWLAIVACIIALVYFIIYNLILAPRCTAKSQHIEELISGSASQNYSNGTNGAGGSTGQGSTSAGAALNGNSNYSPLRVYHNERGKLGQFRF